MVKQKPRSVGSSGVVQTKGDFTLCEAEEHSVQSAQASPGARTASDSATSSADKLLLSLVSFKFPMIRSQNIPNLHSYLPHPPRRA